MSLYSVLRDGARRHPEREFVVHDAARVTWAETDRLVLACAAALARAGVGRGDRVLVLGPTRPEPALVLLACARLGAIYVALSPRAQRHDVAYVCADTRPALLLAMADPDLGDRTGDLADVAADLGLPAPIVLTCTDDGSLAPQLGALLAQAPIDELPDELPDELDPLAIVYTSGTTGDPKGVVLSHRSLLNYRHLLARNALDAPRLLSSMPIDHVGYLGNELTAALLSGGTLVQLRRFDAEKVLDVLQREHVTAWLGAIPTMLNRLVALPGFATADLAALDLLWWVGPLPERTAAAIAAHDVDLGTSYGMSEACCITMTDRGADLAVVLGTVGRPLDDVELRFGPPPDPLSDGEIQLRRVGLMTTYWGKPQATADAIDADGWFSTGDLGHLDLDGNLRITGRLKLLIRTGGYNISPYEIETALEAHPGVAMAVVVALPDEEYGESAHAAWMPAPGGDGDGEPVTGEDLRRYLRELLSGFKVPKQFHRLDQLPLLSNGKADRRGIRERVRIAVATQQSAPPQAAHQHSPSQEPVDVR